MPKFDTATFTLSLTAEEFALLHVGMSESAGRKRLAELSGHWTIRITIDGEALEPVTGFKAHGSHGDIIIALSRLLPEAEAIRMEGALHYLEAGVIEGLAIDTEAMTANDLMCFRVSQEILNALHLGGELQGTTEENEWMTETAGLLARATRIIIYGAIPLHGGHMMAVSSELASRVLTASHRPCLLELDELAAI